MRGTRFLALGGFLLSVAAGSALAQSAAEPIPAIAEFTRAMERHEGFFDFYTEAAAGKIWLQVPVEAREFLYVDYLSSGLGSNPIGLDRGQPGRTRLVAFERVGRKALLIEKNLQFRVTTESEAESRAVADSFPASVLWSAPVAAQSAEAYLLDLTSLVVSDIHGVASSLERAGQGTYRVDLDRSALFFPRIRAFPRNCEFEALLTFTSSQPGRLAAMMSPDPHVVTLREHHSFVALPDSRYQPRRYDPRSGGIPLQYYDYGVPIDESVARRWVVRHRLFKKDPTQAVSEAVEPIVYYVDPGAPEPIRSALIEGASWWEEAFEAAGFRNAFQVKVLPPDADPLDVRYNVIQWVHRSTRGWSYGSSIVDPRTGEIIKGHVTLGSLRIRQDEMIFRGLSPTTGIADNGMVACAMGAAPAGAEAMAQVEGGVRPVEVALARIRQLAAHEVGHTLGFMHNFAASSFDRASVMDYPAAWVKAGEGNQLDFSAAYTRGIGRWDEVSVHYSYAQFAPGENESDGLEAILRQAIDAGMYLISDQDSRPLGAAQPYSSLWDNGASPVAELTNVMAVRRIALARLGEASLKPGEPYAELQRLFVPLYLYHRYQVDAAAKLLGGVDFRYALQGDGQLVQETVNADAQRQALAALLQTLEPSELGVPDRLQAELAPDPPGFSGADRELFEGRSSMIFDPQAAAEVAARLVVANLLQPERAARLIEQSLRDPALPSLPEVVSELLQRTWLAAPLPEGAPAGTARTVEDVVLDELIRLAANPRAAVGVRSVAEGQLWHLRDALAQAPPAGSELESSHVAWAVGEIDRFLGRQRPDDGPTQPLEAPPGSPIGQ